MLLVSGFLCFGGLPLGLGPVFRAGVLGWGAMAGVLG